MNTPDTVVAETRCAKCDADVRDGSLFCYNCGARVADGTEGDIGETPAPTPVAQNAPSAGKPAPGMRSARDLKRRKRAFERKPVQIVWEPAAEGPGIQLIVVTLLILVFTVIVVVLSFSLR